MTTGSSPATEADPHNIEATRKDLRRHSPTLRLVEAERAVASLTTQHESDLSLYATIVEEQIQTHAQLEQEQAEVGLERQARGEVEEQLATAIALLVRARPNVAYMASLGPIERVVSPLDAINAFLADQRAAAEQYLAGVRADAVAKFLGNDDLGIIVDALVAYLPAIRQRKTANAESTSDLRVERFRAKRNPPPHPLPSDQINSGQIRVTTVTNGNDVTGEAEHDARIAAETLEAEHARLKALEPVWDTENCPDCSQP
jgi:hypothetical protein